MKRTVFAVGAVVAAIAAVGVASPSAVLSGGPEQTRVYGGGQITTPTPIPTRTISLDAHTNPQGSGAYGTLRYAGVAPGFRGQITCLSLEGHTALVGGTISEGPTNSVGLDFLYAVTDDGPPASGADRAGFIDLAPERDVPQYPGLPADFPRTCPSAADAQDNLGAFPLTGDIAIETP
jgi:hypothetical protein